MANYVSQVLPLNYSDEAVLQGELNRLLGFDGWSGRIEVRIFTIALKEILTNNRYTRSPLDRLLSMLSSI